MSQTLALEPPPPNFRYLEPPTNLGPSDAFAQYANPDRSDTRPVTLVRPPLYFSKTAYSTPLALPVGLGYLAAVLQKAGYAAQILDCVGRDLANIRLTPDGRFQVQGMDEEASLALIDSASDIIGVTIMFSQEWPLIREYINRLRHAFPRATIVVGGEHVTAMPDYSLQDCPAIDYLVLGEGELSFLELVHRLRAKQPIHGVSGLAFRAPGGKVVQTGLSPRMADIKQMPWPAWDLVDVEAYFRPNFTMGPAHGRNIGMLATRGCPYQCTFCSNPTMWTTRYTMRPVAEVVDEMAHYIERYRVTTIDFYDLTAIVKKSWIMEFIAELERRQLKVGWQLPSGTRSESLDEEVIAGLVRTGCTFLVYAPESGSQRTLDMVKKRVNLAYLQRSLMAAVRQGVATKVNFIIGFPFETRRDMLQTVLFVWKLGIQKVDDCNIALFTPYPGSELYRELETSGALGRIDDAYFENLMTQFDFTLSKTFCRHVGAREIMAYRVVGMAVFYLISYLRAPGRFLRLLQILFQREPFEARSLFEQRVFDFKVRLRQRRRKAAALPSLQQA
ncbi:MAG: B12-binding domain-containing radical SAM protein [Candidatus Omnitrophica bacterium]|nr:B12-binding domain-containing radical SAM protein [Candidatus Omnitrophota bacterium]